MISYWKVLNDNNIKDVEYIDEEGKFYRDFKSLNDHLKVGYNGYVSYDEDGIHILYKKIYYLNYEKHLESTQAYNAEYAHKLIGINIDGVNFETELAIDEIRDAKILYDEYILDNELFNRKQHAMMSIYEINHMLREIEQKREEYYNQLFDIDNNLVNIRVRNIEKKRHF